MLLFAQRSNRVVEARHEDMPRGVLEPGENLGERLRRVRCHAAHQARVHIHGGGLNPKLEIDQAAQRVGNGGKPLGDHRCIADHAVIGRQPVAIRPDKVFEVNAGNLLLALGDHLQIEGKLAGRPKPGLNRLPVQRDLSLVIG